MAKITNDGKLLFWPMLWDDTIYHEREVMPADDSMVLSVYSWSPSPLHILVKQEAERGPEMGLGTNFKSLLVTSL